MGGNDSDASETPKMREITLIEPNDFPVDNSITTAKYEWWNFVPNNLMEQFRRVANVYFLVISVLMYIGTFYSYIFDSPLEPFTTLGPLILVLLITMVKEGYEDSKRHLSDREVNNRNGSVLEKPGRLNREVRWRAMRVGTVVLVEEGGGMPADMVVLQTSKPDGSCYVETSNIDGETDLKTKQAVHAISTACLSASRHHDVRRLKRHASSHLQAARDSRTGEEGEEGRDMGENEGETELPSEAQMRFLASLEGSMLCPPPNAQLYKFEGVMEVTKAGDAGEAPSPVGKHSIGYDNIALRGCTLRNTAWVLGLVTYTGRETKVMMKAGHGKAKMSEVEKTVNRSLVVIFGTQFMLCVITVIAAIAWDAVNIGNRTIGYLDLSASTSEYIIPQWLGDFFTFLILYNNFIPISLYVTVEMVNYAQAALVDTDLLMYDPSTDTPAKARTSNLNQDLGQIEYVFSDKTGTLTRNVMEFRACTIAGRVFGAIPTAAELGGGARGGGSGGDEETGGPRRRVKQKQRRGGEESGEEEEGYYGGEEGGRRGGRACCPLGDQACAIESGAWDSKDPWLKYPPGPARGEIRSTEHFKDRALRDVLARPSVTEHDAADAMLTVMSVCHTVVPEEVELPVGVRSRTRSRSRVALSPTYEPPTSAAQDWNETEIQYQAESPDEGALVRAARDMGYELVARAAQTVTVMIDPNMRNVPWFKAQADKSQADKSQAEKGGEDEWLPLQFRVLGVHKFNSTRKRMSVVVMDPREDNDGGAWLLCKGADNVMLSLATSPADARRDLDDDLRRFAQAGLRTLVLGRRRLSRDEVSRWRRQLTEAQNAIGRKDEALAEVAASVEKNLEILGATAIEDRLQDGVPEAIADLARAGIKTWVLTGDKVETAINIGRTCRLLTPELGEPIVVSTPADEGEDSSSASASFDLEAVHRAARASLLSKLREASDQLDAMENEMGHVSRSPASQRSSRRSASFTRPPKEPTKRSYGAVQDSSSLRRKTTTTTTASAAPHPDRSARVAVGSSPPTSHRPGIVNEEEEEEAEEMSVFGRALAICGLARLSAAELEFRNPRRLPRALVITGDALDHIIRTGKDPETGKRLRRDPEMEQALLRVALRCQAVVACRVSPKQKADVVSLVRNCTSPKPMTLAIGDGANDVGMIQKAQVGVGISGKEGLQAVNSSDFAIAQFRFLRRLLLVHGRWSYRRMSKVLLYSFYKNVVITMTLFLFNAQTGWSGTSYYESIIYSLYNFILGLPIIAVGTLDRDLSELTALRHPGTYMSGLRGMDLSVRAMAWWILQAVLHGLVIFYVPYFAMLQPHGPIWSEGGNSNGHSVAGLTTYSCLIWAMQLKVCLIHATFTWVHVAVLAISFIGWYIFMAIYETMLDISPQFFEVFSHTLAQPVHWLLVLLVLALILILDLIVKWSHFNFFASPVDVAVERDAGFFGDGPQDGPQVLWGDEAQADKDAEPSNASKPLSNPPASQNTAAAPQRNHKSTAT